MDSLPYADIVILALIAGFILLRLRSVLGEKTGHDNPQFFKREEPSQDAEKESVVHIAQKAAKPRPSADADVYMNTLDNATVASALVEIKKLDPQFMATGFLQGAKMAYEMVFDAFAKGDRKTLEMLLDKPLYDTFVREIETREQAAEKNETTLVSVKAKDIVRATLSGSRAQLTVKFDSEQVNLVRDAQGAIISGSASQTEIMDDEWVFERDVSNKNPNWKIIET
jgi:predicted lipid-binding transport protein (Tim44 family)